MTPTASTQIALFVADIRQHLQEEDKLLCSVSREGSFDAGFQEGVLLWHKFQRFEEDFFYALSVLQRMLEPLDASLPKINKLEWSGQTRHLLLEHMSKEIQSRDKQLEQLQRSLLDIPPFEAEQRFGKEVSGDFEQTFQDSLIDLLQ